MNQCTLPVKAGWCHPVSGLLWCGWMVVVLVQGWPQQRLRLLKAGWPHHFLDALQVWGLSTYSARPHALITGWIHRLAWKQRSSWGKWHQRSTGVICFKRSRAVCQVLHLRKYHPLSQGKKKRKEKEKQKKRKRCFQWHAGPFQCAFPTFGWDVGEGSFSWHQMCSGLLFSKLQSWCAIKMPKKLL